jgi:hypothetical protein
MHIFMNWGLNECVGHTFDADVTGDISKKINEFIVY